MYQSITQFNSEFYMIILKVSCGSFWGFPGGTVVKNPSAIAGDVRAAGLTPGSGRSLGGRKWQSTPVFLPGKSPWTKEPGRLQSMGLQRIGHNPHTCMHVGHFKLISYRVKAYKIKRSKAYKRLKLTPSTPFIVKNLGLC